MTSDEWSGALLAALGGVALGGFFFGGLWWTLQRTLRSAHVVSWQLASLLVRNAVALGGFWLRRVVAALAVLPFGLHGHAHVGAAPDTAQRHDAGGAACGSALIN